jgi:hemoglobin-like flavoprotein
MSDRDFDQGVNEARATLLRVSFQRLLPNAELVAELFYERLFLLDPSLRPLFRGDMRSQGRKLMSVLQVVVAHADRLEVLTPVVRGLGQRHVGYGVRDEHYETVRSALIWTLQQTLGDDLTPATAAAWADMYDQVASVMRSAAHEPLSQRAPASQRAPRSVRSTRSPLSARAPLSQPPA